MNMAYQSQATPPPVFIFSCARAGSTLLRYIIDTHPAICSPAEMQMGELCQKLFLSLQATLGQVCGADDQEERDRVVHAEIRRIIYEMMEKYTTAKGKRMWCEKTPWNLNYLDLLQAIFPDAKYICLYRNCMDVAASCLENIRLRFADELFQYYKKYPGDKVSAVIDYWNDETKKLLAFEREHAESCFRIKYEWVVQEPQKTLEQLFAFLGLSFEPDLLNSVFSIQHDEGFGDPKIMYSKSINQGSIGTGSTISLSQIQEPLLKTMNSLLAELDYPTVGPDWDTAPSPYLKSEHAAATSKSISTTAEIFASYIPRQLESQAETLPKINAVYKIIVTGEGGGIWLLDLTKPGGQITFGNGRAGCTIRMAADDLLDIVNGRLNVAAAFDRGKLQVLGNPALAEKIGQVLFGR
jgi:protein-tyrosine sulfotransferase